jgi:peroxiredoxin
MSLSSFVLAFNLEHIPSVDTGTCAASVEKLMKLLAI